MCVGNIHIYFLLLQCLWTRIIQKCNVLQVKSKHLILRRQFVMMMTLKARRIYVSSLQAPLIPTNTFTGHLKTMYDNSHFLLAFT